MRFRRDYKQQIQNNITGLVARGVEDETSLVMDRVSELIPRGKELFFKMEDCEASREMVYISSATLLKKSSKKVRTLLVLPTMERLRQIKEVYKRLDGRNQKVAFLDEEQVQQEFKKLRRSPILLIGTAQRIIDHLRRGNLDLSGVQQMTLDVLPAQMDHEGFQKDISFIFTRFSKKVQIFLFSPMRESVDLFLPFLKRYEDLQMPVLQQLDQPKETIQMGTIDTEDFQAAIDTIIKRVRDQEDPEQLKEFKKLFKKSVPMGLRPWVIGYLFKQALGKGGGRSRNGSSANFNRLKDGVNLFVGVGRKRKIFPKDIIHLFITKGGVQREDIGEIKILDSYSFVSVKESVAAEAISKMDGLAFRGRKLNVNFAKQK